jgi:hypothetical protein
MLLLGIYRTKKLIHMFFNTTKKIKKILLNKNFFNKQITFFLENIFHPRLKRKEGKILLLMQKLEWK